MKWVTNHPPTLENMDAGNRIITLPKIPITLGVQPVNTHYYGLPGQLTGLL